MCMYCNTKINVGYNNCTQCYVDVSMVLINGIDDSTCMCDQPFHACTNWYEERKEISLLSINLQGIENQNTRTIMRQLTVS